MCRKGDTLAHRFWVHIVGTSLQTGALNLVSLTILNVQLTPTTTLLWLLNNLEALEKIWPSKYTFLLRHNTLTKECTLVLKGLKVFIINEQNSILDSLWISHEIGQYESNQRDWSILGVLSLKANNRSRCKFTDVNGTSCLQQWVLQSK